MPTLATAHTSNSRPNPNTGYPENAAGMKNNV
jgi:hypothetical protein